MLAGREGLLAELHSRLAPDCGDGPYVAALVGLGGAGKTSVAIEYAYRHQAEMGVMWQLAAEDPMVLEAGFARLAAQLGAAGGLLEARDPVAFVHAVLAASPVPWLLVFDNAPRPGWRGRIFAPRWGRHRADHQPEWALAARPGPRSAGAGH